MDLNIRVLLNVFFFIPQIQQHKAIKYDISPLSQISRHRLSMVNKKVLVLDLDET
jgi:CTD nuclear envelope phosphatase 1